jgi:tRNA uridine 5-carboxymethylaminomethyl modification enzyme
LNAAKCAGGGEGVTFDRAEAYLGVMIDDLVTRGVAEPYRMFTSRAEYRLTLRADNADQRLTQKGVTLGCVGAVRRASFGTKIAKLDEARAFAKSKSVTPNEAQGFGIQLKLDGQRRTAFDLLSYPSFDASHVARIWPEFSRFESKIVEQLEIDAKYAVYLERQAEDVARFREEEALAIPAALDYENIPGLSLELRHKLGAVRPRTIGHANRIEGMTPAALALVALHARRA